jgi:hypothetical protein
MRLIFPFASALSAIRSRFSFSRTMANASDNYTSDMTIRCFLKDIYQKTNPRNVFSVYVTGGGSTSLEWLFTVPGASNSLTDAGVVYSRSALEALIEDNLDPAISASSCSSSTALTMADASWQRANRYLLAESRDFNNLRDVNLFGVSCTASLVSERPKKGAHRVHIASTSQAISRLYTVEFEKGRRTRPEEDAACSRLLLEAVAACSGTQPLPTDYLFPQTNSEIHDKNDNKIDEISLDDSNLDQNKIEVIKTTVIQRSDVMEKIYNREIQQALFVKRSAASDTKAARTEAADNTAASTSDNSDSSADISPDDDYIHREFVVLEDVSLPKGTLVFSGSFNPLHEGHISLIVAALERLSGTPSSPDSSPDSSPNPSPSISPISSSNPNTNSGLSRLRTGSIDKTYDPQRWKNIPVVFEIAAINADKPPIPRYEYCCLQTCILYKRNANINIAIPSIICVNSIYVHTV